MATSEHFSDAELRCNHCGVNKVDPEALAKLEQLRSALGDKPMVVTSGYRCSVHNSAVSSTGLNGPHTTGTAFDIAVRGYDCVVMAAAAMAVGFTGFGFQQKGGARFLHLDTVGKRCWSY